MFILAASIAFIGTRTRAKLTNRFKQLGKPLPTVAEISVDINIDSVMSKIKARHIVSVVVSAHNQSSYSGKNED